MIEKLFLKILIMKQKEVQFKKKAKSIYDLSNKKAPILLIEKMLWHISSC